MNERKRLAAAIQILRNGDLPAAEERLLELLREDSDNARVNNFSTRTGKGSRVRTRIRRVFGEL